MNPFTEQWLCATLVPESIVNIKSQDNYYLDVIRNESNTKHVQVLSSNNHIQAIGTDYTSLINSPQYTFSAGLHKIAELLGITSISTN